MTDFELPLECPMKVKCKPSDFGHLIFILNHKNPKNRGKSQHCVYQSFILTKLNIVSSSIGILDHIEVVC